MQSTLNFAYGERHNIGFPATERAENGASSPSQTTAAALPLRRPESPRQQQQPPPPQQASPSSTDRENRKHAPHYQNGLSRRDGVSASTENSSPKQTLPTMNGTPPATTRATAYTTTITYENPLRPFVALEAAEKRSSRKRKLFAMLSTYDNAKLDELATTARVPTIAQLLSARKQPAATVAARAQIPTDLPAAVGLFPSPPLAAAALKTDNDSLPQKSLQDLEQETLSFHIPAAQSQHNIPKIRTFSIRFHEGSLAAMARWSISRANKNSLQHQQQRPSKQHASVETKYRRCGTCGNWGHLETSCTHTQPIETYRILPSKSSNHQQPAADDCEKPAETRKSPPKTEEDSRVCVEDCDGFMIEQRAGPRSENKNKRKELDKEDEIVETTIGGVRIKAGTSYSGRGGAASFKEGDVIAWKLTEDRILTGIVETIDLGRGQVKARCIRSLVLDAAANAKSEQEEDVKGVLFVLPARRCRQAKRSDLVNSSHIAEEKGLSLNQRKRRALKSNGDGTMRSSTAPSLNFDGTYQEPRGRKPGGMKWDPKRGVWTPCT